LGGQRAVLVFDIAALRFGYGDGAPGQTRPILFGSGDGALDTYR